MIKVFIVCTIFYFQTNTDPGLDMGIDVGSSGGVELRQGGRGRRGVEKKDSGYYSFITEHPPVSPRTMGEGVRHTTSKTVSMN